MRRRVAIRFPSPAAARAFEASLEPVPAWLEPAARSVVDQLRAFAAKYPQRFVYRDGKLIQRRP